MKIEKLTDLGFPEYFIKTWRQCGIEELFPLQAKVLSEDALFNQQNLVISSPTASGKTFLAEMAAINTILSNRQVLYLAPLRSLAEEKYREFHDKYHDYGLKVLISTGERSEHDHDIVSGKFDLAVIVYEKVLSFLTIQPTLLNLLGLVIIDELQNIGQDNRGVILEYIICLLKEYRQIKILGLSAVIPTNDPLIKWLNAILYNSLERPNELKEGILLDNVFYYQEYNSGKKGKETLIRNNPDNGLPNTWNIALDMAERGEQSIIFLPDKQSTRMHALTLARESNLPEAREAVAELQLLEQTITTLQLQVTLRAGIAFHNADLTCAERRIIENYFKKGQIRLVTATTTLAMGVNLPSKNVFIDPHIWRYDPICKRPYLDILTKNEKENEAGRAGRFGSQTSFGRMVIPASSRKEFDTYWNTYVEKKARHTKPSLALNRIAPIILWLTCGKTQKKSDLLSFFQTTYTHFYARERKQEPDWQEAIEKTIKELAANKLIYVNSKGKIIPSPLAKLAAAKGISTDTAIQLNDWLNTTTNRYVADLEIFYAAALTENGHDFHLSVENQPQQKKYYFDYLENHLSQDAKEIIKYAFGETTTNMFFQLKEVKIPVVLELWLGSQSTLSIENATNCYAGELTNLGKHFAWIVGAAALICRDIRHDNRMYERLNTLKERLIFGVNKESLELARLRIPSLGRENCQKLVREGIDNLEGLRAVDPKHLERLLKPRIAQKILEDMARQNNLALRQSQPAQPEETFTADIIEITNQYRGRHYFISVNGQNVKLTRRLFEIILRLALEKKANSGWVHKLDEAICDERLSQVTRLRNLLKPYLHKSPKLIIESDQFGSLRLSLPPQNLIFDQQQFSDHPHESIRELITTYNHSSD